MRLGIDTRAESAAARPRASPSFRGARPASVTAPTPATWAFLLISGALILCLGFAIAWYQSIATELEERTTGDVFAQRRSVRLMDLNFPRLHAEYGPRFRVPIRFRLAQTKQGTRIRVISTQDKVLAERAVAWGDLDQEGITERYRRRTGEPANSVTLYFRKGRAMLLVQQID